MPRYSSNKGRWLTGGDTETPAASAARTTTGNSGTLDAAFRTYDFLIDVTVATGTSPTLNVAVEESSDGTTWTAVSNANQNSVGQTRIRGTVARAYYRAVWTIGGTTPSFTFSVSGDVK